MVSAPNLGSLYPVSGKPGQLLHGTVGLPGTRNCSFTLQKVVAAESFVAFNATTPVPVLENDLQRLSRAVDCDAQNRAQFTRRVESTPPLKEAGLTADSHFQSDATLMEAP